MNHIQILLAAVVLAFFATTVSGQEPPKFFKETYPEHALEAALGARGVLRGKEAKLDVKTRKLVSLGVAAQIPCIYCVYIHTKNARAAGARSVSLQFDTSLVDSRIRSVC